MKTIKYFFEYIFISVFFLICKIIGYEKSSNLGEKVGRLIGPLFRNKKNILLNLKLSKIANNDSERSKIISTMWGNYGRMLSEYPHIKSFRNSTLSKYINVKGEQIFDKIKSENKPVIFVSGHFNNFELMAMEIEKRGINLAAIYRPLNNFFLNKTMEKIRINYICKNQIKKGKSGTRQIVDLLKRGHSIALMIDQRVTEGEIVKLFYRDAKTTTIPAQLVKKYKLEVVPVYISRSRGTSFEIIFQEPLKFNENETIDKITLRLNGVLEKMIIRNPGQWIWTHNRWK